MSKKCKLGAEAACAGFKGRVFVVQEQVAQVLKEEPDGIHDMRVASRRLRAVLSDFAPLLPEEPREAFQAYVKAITRLLGEPRELDVMVQMLERRRKNVNGSLRLAYNYALRRVRARRKALSSQCLEAARQVDNAVFGQHVTLLENELGTLSKCYVRQARQNLLRKYKKLCADYKRGLHSKNEEVLHDLRITFKKFRYACELYAPLYGEDFMLFLKRLKATQDELGDWNDFRTLRNELIALGREAPPKSAQGFPAIIRDAKRRCQNHREAFERQARKFFSKSRIKAVEYLLRHPIEPCCMENEAAPKKSHPGESMIHRGGGSSPAIRLPG